MLRTTAVGAAEASLRQQPADGNGTAAPPDVVVRVETALFALTLPGWAVFSSSCMTLRASSIAASCVCPPRSKVYCQCCAR